jgi:hypothetical protein
MISHQMTVPQGDMHSAHTMFFAIPARVQTARFSICAGSGKRCIRRRFRSVSSEGTLCLCWRSSL